MPCIHSRELSSIDDGNGNDNDPIVNLFLEVIGNIHQDVLVSSALKEVNSFCSYNVSDHSWTTLQE